MGRVIEEVVARVERGGIVGLALEKASGSGELRVERVLRVSALVHLLKEGDRILEVNGASVSGEGGRAEVLLRLASGSHIRLLISRSASEVRERERESGAEWTGQRLLGPEWEAGRGLTVDWRGGKAGLHLKDEGGRVLVSSLLKGGLADSWGLDKGIWILAVNAVPVTDAHAAKAEMRRARGVFEMVYRQPPPSNSSRTASTSTAPSSAPASQSNDPKRIARALQQHLRQICHAKAEPASILLNPSHSPAQHHVSIVTATATATGTPMPSSDGLHQSSRNHSSSLSHS